MLADSEAGDLRPHSFGGDWTDRKLEVVSKYLAAYNTALSKTRFERVYIDAFAGTPYRAAKSLVPELAAPLFAELDEGEPLQLKEGSARLALKSEPRFNKYVFIERSPARCKSLESLRVDFSDRARDITIERAEANEAIRRLCSQDWTNRRAVLFLDPYGMQVEWKTIKAIAETGAIDLWLLVPVGIALQRLLTRTGEMPDGWRERINTFLGDHSWYDEMYRPTKQASLFDDHEPVRARVDVESIGRVVLERLRRVFVGVADPAGELRNSKGTPLYMLCFACSNARGTRIALNIANHLIANLK